MNIENIIRYLCLKYQAGLQAYYEFVTQLGILTHMIL